MTSEVVKRITDCNYGIVMAMYYDPETVCCATNQIKSWKDYTVIDGLLWRRLESSR